MAGSIQNENAPSVVVRDTERFKLLFTNSRPHIPGGKLLPLSMRTTRSQIAERVQNAALRCEQKR